MQQVDLTDGYTLHWQPSVSLQSSSWVDQRPRGSIKISIGGDRQSTEPFADADEVTVSRPEKATDLESKRCHFEVDARRPERMPVPTDSQQTY